MSLSLAPTFPEKLSPTYPILSRTPLSQLGTPALQVSTLQLVGTALHATPVSPHDGEPLAEGCIIGSLLGQCHAGWRGALDTAGCSLRAGERFGGTGNDPILCPDWPWLCRSGAGGGPGGPLLLVSPLESPGWFAQQPLALQLRHSEQPTVPLELQASQGAPSLSQRPSILVKPSSPLSLALTRHIFRLQAFPKSCARHSSPVLSCLPSPLLPWMQAPPPPDITHGLARE